MSKRVCVRDIQAADSLGFDLSMQSLCVFILSPVF